MSKIKDAALLFDKGFNCAQSLIVTYGDELGIDKDLSLKITNAFGGGMGRMGETCGAVTGALMVIGLKYGTADIKDKASKEKTYELTKKFIQKFSARNGSITCKELLGFELLSGNNDHRSREIISNKCPKLVKDAAEIMEEIL